MSQVGIYYPGTDFTHSEEKNNLHVRWNVSSLLQLIERLDMTMKMTCWLFAYFPLAGFLKMFKTLKKVNL